MIPLKTASKTIKYLGINLTKELKDLYSENYKTLMKEVEDTNKWKISCTHGLEKVTSLKCQYYQTIYTFIAMSIKIPMALFSFFSFSFYLFIYFFFYFLAAPWHMELPSQESDLSSSLHLNCCSKAGSLTHCAGWALNPSPKMLLTPLCHSGSSSNGIFYRSRKNSSKIYMGPQNIPNTQRNPRGQRRKHNTS